MGRYQSGYESPAFKPVYKVYLSITFVLDIPIPTAPRFLDKKYFDNRLKEFAFGQQSVNPCQCANNLADRILCHTCFLENRYIHHRS